MQGLLKCFSGLGDDIGLGLSPMADCFDFGSTNVVQLSNSTGFNVITP